MSIVFEKMEEAIEEIVERICDYKEAQIDKLIDNTLDDKIFDLKQSLASVAEKALNKSIRENISPMMQEYEERFCVIKFQIKELTIQYEELLNELKLKKD